MEHLVKPKSPCSKDCPYRDVYCRIDCDEYKEYEEKYMLYNEKKNKSRQKEEPIVQYHKEILTKQRKRNRRNG